jgi:hypothetical protein
MNTTVLTVRNDIKDPSRHQVKLRKINQQHEYVVPSSFATIPTNNVQKRIMRNAYNRKRISFPPSIKEEDEDLAVETAIDEDEDIPLAVLAYKKGFIVPNRIENVFPLIQHIPHHFPGKHIRNCHHSPRDSSTYYTHCHHCDTAAELAMNPKSQWQQQHQQFYQLQQDSSSSSISSSSSEALSFTRRAHSNKKGFFRRQSSLF